MQAHLKDVTRPNHTSDSFLICQRVLNQCQEIIYGDLPESGNPYSSSALGFTSLSSIIRKKLRPNASPALVGMGIVLASVPGMPILAEVVGEVALEQGRIDDQGNDLRSLDVPENIIRTRSNESADKQEDDGEDDISDSEDAANVSGKVSVAQPNPSPSPSPRFIGSSKAARRQTIAAQTSPALPLHMKAFRKPRLSEDPFGQNDDQFVDSPVLPSPFQSTPTFSAARHFRRPNNLISPETLLQKYDLEAQKYLLRGHYCRSEVRVDSKDCTSPLPTIQIQFILALENICNRLLVVPKPARVSALRAELTSLNHMLPAEVILGFDPYSFAHAFFRYVCQCGVLRQTR